MRCIGRRHAIARLPLLHCMHNTIGTLQGWLQHDSVCVCRTLEFGVCPHFVCRQAAVLLQPTLHRKRRRKFWNLQHFICIQKGGQQKAMLRC